MKENNFETGIALGREHYTQITQRGNKWKSRHIPIYIRKRLMVPYYIVQLECTTELWIINYPEQGNGKVAFNLFATKNETTQIYDCPKCGS